MQGIADDTIGGFNTFLKDQKKVKGRATFSLVQFDSQDPHEVIYDFEDIKNVKRLDRDTFVPRGTTPLLDAIGKTIHSTAAGISGLKKKPDCTVFVIITDGQENASKELKLADVKQLIESKQKDKWEIVFLSSDMASFHDALSYGIGASHTAFYANTGAGIHGAFSTTSSNLAGMRSGASMSMGYSDNDRNEMQDDDNKSK